MLHTVLQKVGRWLRSSGLFLWWNRSPANESSHRRATLPSSQRLGRAGEKAAARYLRAQGYRILARGHRQRLGEIDLIAIDQGCIVFVEVKTWVSASAGDPSQAVDLRKQEKLTRAALIYLKKKNLLEHPARFDVISIVWPDSAVAQPTIRHFKNAFEAIGRGQMFN